MFFLATILGPDHVCDIQESSCKERLDQSLRQSLLPSLRGQTRRKTCTSSEPSASSYGYGELNRCSNRVQFACPSMVRISSSMAFLTAPGYALLLSSTPTPDVSIVQESVLVIIDAVLGVGWLAGGDGLIDLVRTEAQDCYGDWPVDAPHLARSLRSIPSLLFVLWSL